ncbi:endonuclease domain-containing protein [Curtobacterium sp. MCBD17_019]|uniref:endonuclease domain-containing protein n=1 Tax=Curtobacterium sp. MCBD17_019 TaxID=2175669 RepID=UPI000DA7DA93|nr:hypothetical protein [Curtobacterium sp. MCBD17_019]PZE74734.1 hypothetical protein DEI82_09930 [Curtobacterium sp. MCBD17_019]
MTRTPARLPDPFLGQAFHTADAVRNGVTPGRLRREDLAAPTRGVRVPAELDLADLSARVAAFGLVLGERHHFSHTTALALWELPLPPWVVSDATVHVSTVGDGPVMRRTGVVGHRVSPPFADVVACAGLPASSPVAAWCESAGLLAERDLVVIGDHLVARALADPEQLERRSRERRSRWARRLRAAAHRVRLGSESPMETLIRLVIVDAGFPEPQLNTDVHSPAGRFLGRVDLAYPDLRIGVEYDGEHHRTDRATWQHDATRSNGFVSAGWLILHVTARDVADPTAFLLRLSDVFRTRASSSLP